MGRSLMKVKAFIFSVKKNKKKIWLDWLITGSFPRCKHTTACCLLSNLHIHNHGNDAPVSEQAELPFTNVAKVYLHYKYNKCSGKEEKKPVAMVAADAA